MKKILLLVAITFFISLGSSYIYYKKQTQKIEESIYLNYSQKVKNNFQELVAQKKGKTAALTYILSQDSKLGEALAKKDSGLIHYKDIIQGIEKHDKYENLWIQIIDKNGDSFYRSWTNKVGDNVSSIRGDVALMLQVQKPIRQISTGRFDMTFKTIFPLFYENQFVGMIEMISKFNSISNELKENGIESVMIVDKSYRDKFIKPFTGLFIDEYYITNKDASKKLIQEIKDEGIERFLLNDRYFLFKNHLVVTDQIENIKKKPMGYFVLFTPLENIDMSVVNEFKVDYLKRITVAGIIATLLLLIYINRKFVKILNLEVAEKTKKILKQKEYLTSLLKIYDKNVIFSKTDLKGIITHVSEAFCKISGYKKEELIGKNHNIIRHPDMPKEAFKYLWDELQKGNKVNLEIKNRKKDGGYYWVDAEVEPEYDKRGNLIGYNATREDITANKDVEAIQKEIIFTMGSIGESRSKETGNHVKRVAEYSKLLAKLSGICDEECETIMQASPMHDIGKVAIPDSILNKPGKLTDEEFEMMKAHVTKGYEMLKTSDRPLLKMASIVALEHHEKWDGSGYPKGLKQEEISIYGRITALADVFDALGSHRCYKEAWEDEKIFKFFKEERGKHFDPKLVDLFFEHQSKFMAIRDKYSDKEI